MYRITSLFCAALLCGMPTANAQSVDEIKASVKQLKPADYPARPIELVVAYPAGGGMDLTTRILAKYLEKYTGETIVVANKSGAAGLVGHGYLTRQARPDGYTLGVVASNFWSDSIFRAEGKWSYKDVDPIAFVNYDPVTWIVTTDGIFKDKDLKGIVEHARAHPGAVRAAGASTTATAFTLEQVQAATDTKFLPVMYQGGRQALTDLMGGHIDVSFGYQGEYRGQMDAGRIKPIAVTSNKRVPSLPDVPTFNEVLGTTDIVWDAFRFAVVPKGVPEDRKKWLEAALNAALADPDIEREYAELGATVDRSLDSAKKVAAEVDRRAEAERDYFVKTGRIK